MLGVRELRLPLHLQMMFISLLLALRLLLAAAYVVC